MDLESTFPARCRSPIRWAASKRSTRIELVENDINRPVSLSSVDDHCDRDLVTRPTLRIESKLKNVLERKYGQMR